MEDPHFFFDFQKTINPKFEYRNPKQIQMTKTKRTTTHRFMLF
jgi:hypothetical protein